MGATVPQIPNSTQPPAHGLLRFAVAELSPAPAPPPKPEHLGPYELLIELASGGMATVHLARATDKRQGPPLVAVKRPHRHLQGDKTFLTMLVDEARLASAITHPSVVKVRELGFDGGMPFIVMDYVEGTSLAELRRELSAIGRAIDVRVAVRIIVDALAGLHAAHELKDDNGKALHIIHRDVSPHNVLIGCDGRSYVTDFGIAKAEDRIQTTRTHEVKGKLAYLAPERIDKRRICTVQSDVFSMAVVLWECFAGRRLFRGEEPVDVLQEVMLAPIPTLKQIGAQIPAAVDDVIARALSRDLDTRYASAQELAHAIERAAGPEHIGTHADVARLMEAIFGARMTLRQEQVRAAIGPSELTQLLRESGLPTRDRVSMVDIPTGQLLAELAPPAPTGRYALGTELRMEVAKLRPKKVPWWSVGAVAGGVAAGALVTLAVVANRPKPGPIVIRGTPTASAATIAVAPTARKVVLPLPFIATHVELDDVARELDPAAEVAAFDVPAESGPRHKVAAVAIDGTRVEGFVREQDGIARPEGDGFAYIPPEPPAAEPHPPAPARPTRPIGTVHNGFTKLR
jgi:serine/threonine-protein kinase